jgi:4-hydroxybenzoate polyprenyltransferase
VTPWIRLIRVHQWAKNSLLLLPALAAHLHPIGDWLPSFGIAFLSFSLLASSLYILNDLADLEHDRAHATKRRRPLASGEVRPIPALGLMAVMATTSFWLALGLPSEFLAVWVVYPVLAISYSWLLKRVVLLDVVVLAALYTVRVIAGAAAVDVPLSRWFLAFSVFLFLSLALLKRSVEVGRVEDEQSGVPGRGWRVVDIPLLRSLGVGSAVTSALVYCLYITDLQATRLYQNPGVLWAGLPIFLYWVGRVWLLEGRGEMHEDPVAFALKDRVSYAVLAFFAVVVMAAS